MSAKERPFRFFDLPKELRDAVYELLPYGRRIIKKAAGKKEAYSLWQSGRPLQHFALVSKQFSAEYTERASKRNDIHVQDNEKGEIVRLELSPAAAAASTVTFELVHLNWDYGYLNHHVEQIQDILAQMTKKPVVRIRFYCQVDEYFVPYQGEDLVAKYKDELAILQGIAQLELLELCAYGNAHQTEREAERKLMASYTKSDGWKTYRVIVGEVEYDSDLEEE